MNISTYTLAALTGILLTSASCQSTKKKENATNATMDTTAVTTDTALVASMRANQDYRLQDSVSILFIVSNPTPDTLRFTQYHTPFEGFMSNFLTITDASGAEVPYIGAMTRRIMPPPEETYHTLAPGAQDSVRFDLSKGYRFEKPGTYTLRYNSGTISGIAKTEAMDIVLK